MATQILYVQSSIFGAQGASSSLAAKLLNGLMAKGDSELVTRDVSNGDLDHFTLNTIQQIGEGKATQADALIAEVKAADIVVLAAPMYNFSIPSQLKSWIDHICRAGDTFKYTESGPVGLLQHKKVYVVSTRGGMHCGQPSDLVTPYLTMVLGFVGLTDIEFIYQEGIAMGDEAKAASLAAAEAQIASLL